MDVNLNIEEKDIEYLKEYLKDKAKPVDLDEIAYRLALFKTRETRSHRVKLYNPNCEYKVGDLILKEYPGKIPVGSKKTIEIDGGVVLKVVAVRTRFGIDEIQLKYEGTSEFKQYTDYLERQKIELLLPHKQAKPCEKPEFLPEDSDPRKQQDPLEKRDFSALKKKLAGAFNKVPDIILISRKVLLKEHLKTLDDTVFTKIKEFLNDSKKSETTEFFIENFARIKPEDEEFDSYCFALNHRMMKDFKIDFQQTQDLGWGKWNLISVIYYMQKDSPVSGENPLANQVTIANKRNLLQRRRKFEEELFQEGNMRFHLTQREITAGAIRLKPGFFDLGDSIEVEVVDSRQKKSYVVYYYKDIQLMLGFKEIFDRYKALQGTIVSFELNQEGKLFFTIRTTKKGTIADRIQYIPEEKAFKVSEEKVASPVFVNKAMFLESPVIRTLYEKLDEFRKAESLNKLIHKVFLEFGVKERNYEIHLLRLYHILDFVYPMDLKLVEDAILGNDEFVPAEKMSGVFYLDSDAVTEIEEEEVKRKESQADESKKREEELKRKKVEKDRRIKDEIRRKREDRRRKREQEMWEKERLKKEMDEKRSLELKKKKEENNRRKAALKAEKIQKIKEKPKPTVKKFEPDQQKEFKRKGVPPQPPRPSGPTPSTKPLQPTQPPRPTKVPQPQKPRPDFSRPQPHPPAPPQPHISHPSHPPHSPHPAHPHPPSPTAPKEDALWKKEAPLRWDKEKRKIEEEKPEKLKVARKPDKRPTDETLTEDEIKSQIEFEKLKERMRDQSESRRKEIEKEKKIAYRDGGGFGGIFASQLDKVVKKEEKKTEPPQDQEEKDKKKP